MQSQKLLNKFIKTVTQTKFDTPYMLVNVDVIRKKCLEFKKYLPNIKLYYAMKSFNDIEVLQGIDDLVDGYDVASVTEIKQLLSFDVAPYRMAYNNPVKSLQDIQQAYKLGVRKYTFQSKGELKKLADKAPNSDVFLRMHVADSTSEISFSSKFGANKSDSVDLLIYAKNLGLNPIGITFHVGSQAENKDVWEKAIKRCNDVINELNNRDIKIEIINLGGGIPTQYSLEDPKFNVVADGINRALTTYLPKIDAIAEPGRYLVADSSVIVASVIGVEERQGMPWIFIDTGTFQSFFEVFEFGYFPYPVYSLRHQLSVSKRADLIECALTGPSCDSYDTMSRSLLLPSDIHEGDKLIIGMAGAYTVVYGSKFNGFPVPKRIYI